jgi:hypothetical protein
MTTHGLGGLCKNTRKGARKGVQRRAEGGAMTCGHCGGATGVVSYPKTRSKVPKFGLDGKEMLKKQILIFHVV